MTGAPILSVRDLQVHFPTGGGLLRRNTGVVRSVDGVSFDLAPGETLSVVGESGCGKTTMGRALLRIVEPTGGTIRFHDKDGTVQDIRGLDKAGLRRFRRDVRMVFQDPVASLNPRLPVSEIIGESVRNSGVTNEAEIRDRVAWLLTRVGLRPDIMHRYPHAFSGGERQRIGIARALAPKPRVVIADEALSALDVSVQAQTINLMIELQAEFGLTYLFIAHDLSVVSHISDRVAVMYLGRIVELAPASELFESPRHPYTRALLASAPVPASSRSAARKADRRSGRSRQSALWLPVPPPLQQRHSTLSDRASRNPQGRRQRRCLPSLFGQLAPCRR
jgi:peptide/nickel transport system ATP-binding protein